MIAVDTNVLIRIVVDDFEERAQTEIARQLVQAAGQVYVPQIVQVESVWVLETCYKFDKPTILGVLDHLRENNAFILQRSAIFQTALETFRISNADFADCIILAESQQFGVPLYTFDKRCGKLSGANWLTTRK
jgi:predicted nucleic-acid-binding protein